MVIKPNIGGSGAGIEKFSSRRRVAAAVEANACISASIQHGAGAGGFTAREAIITRVEVLGGKYLYAIQIHITGESFNLCPADICQEHRGEELTRIACPVDAPKTGMTVEGYEPPRRVIEDVERIMASAGVEVGGIEYVIDDRTGGSSITTSTHFRISWPIRCASIGFNPYARLADFLIAEAREARSEGRPRKRLVASGEAAMRYGYWLPVFGGWLRNVEDENMEASWSYVKKLAQRSEQIGFDLTLIAELNLNDIKGVEAPSLDAWSTAAALAAVTERIELMVAVRPTFHLPALLAKQAANIDHISDGRLTLNVVSSWWADEARKYGVAFEQHDDRYARTGEWLDVLDGAWKQDHFSFSGKYYRVEDNVLEPKPVSQPRPTFMQEANRRRRKS